MKTNQDSMLDIAYDLLTKSQTAINFYKLFEDVSTIKGFDQAAIDSHRSIFYTSITLDGRFITVGENQWDLRTRHKFENVHIDMNDIYADEDVVEIEEDLEIDVELSEDEY